MIFNQRKTRILFLLPAMLALLAGLWAGLARIGWQLPVWQPQLLIGHGPLMISGFLGTLINLERAVALGKPWAYLGAMFNGMGALMLVFQLGGKAGPVLVTLGSIWMVIIFISILRQHLTTYTVVMTLGALAWVVGNVLWLLGWPVARFVFWWVGFLVLTITGERLDLGRLMRLSRTVKMLYLTASGIFLAGLLASLWNMTLGVRLAGVGMLALAIWLLRYDIARKTVRQTGLPRYVAVCLLSGYFWLGFSGIMGVLFVGTTAGPSYDILLHSVMLGFVISMIFGHAPIIFPAILNTQINFRPIFYLPVVLLHTTLLVRVLADFAGLMVVRQWAGMLNAITILLFFALFVPKPWERKRSY